MQPLAQSIAIDRQRLGLSQHELAKRIGVSQQSVAKWENGQSLPRGKRLAGLTSVLGKTSQTAQVIDSTMRRTINNELPDMGSMQPIPITQAQALAALASAAQDLAKAAQAIAESVQKIAAPQPGKH